jgi:transmembrane sensor
MTHEEGSRRQSTTGAIGRSGLTALDWARKVGLEDELLARIESRLRRRRRVMGGASALLAVLVAVLWVAPWLRDTAEMGTAGRRQTFSLADGSSMDLNARSSAHTDFRYGRRIVRLDRGEAFFSVVKDPKHPFVVETPAGSVRVTGTHFNVQLISGHEAVVALVEGAVTVTPASGAEPPNHSLSMAPIHLVPGQVFDSSRPELRTLSAAEMGELLAWRQGRLVLDGLTLAEVAARLGAYHGREITVAPDVAGLRPGGAFPIDDLGAFLSALESALSVRVVERSDGSYRIVSR